MKYILTLYILIIFTAKSYAQTEYPFFQQLAFNFYAEKIIKDFPVKERIRVSKSLSYNFKDEIYSIPNCLKNAVPGKTDSIHKIDYLKYYSLNDQTDRFELDLNNLDKTQFKIKKKFRGVFPKLFVLFPKIYKDRIFVIIHEKWELKGNVYTIEFDEFGEVIDWCREPYQTVIVN